MIRSYNRACPECRRAGAWSLCTHQGPHGPQTAQRVSPRWLELWFRKDRLEDTGMCEKTSACGCTGTSAPPTAGIGAGIGKAVFTFIGGCFALVIAVGVFRLLEPWLITAGVLTVGVYGTRTAIRARRWWRQRRMILAPAPDPVLTARQRTLVHGVEVNPSVEWLTARPAIVARPVHNENVPGR